MKMKEAFDKAVTFLKDKKFASPRLDVEILFASALNIDRIKIYTDYDRPLDEQELNKCREVLRRRGQGEPVAYILGHKDFFNLTFVVSPNVLVPRPETELLVERALDKIAKINLALVADLGTGSGCVGFSIAKNSQALVHCFDQSLEAVHVANMNCNKLALNDSAKVHVCDVSSAKQTAEILSKAQISAFDVIVANPPYIDKNDKMIQAEVVKYEPQAALFAAENGLGALKSWSSLWSKYLKPKGHMFFEIGYAQGPEMKKFFESLNFTNVHVHKDLAGHDRVIEGEKHG
jgi:release factor glutamine methyltransferase